MSTRYWLDTSGDWNATANWSGATVPVNGDDVYILSGAQNIATNLDQHLVALNSLTIGMGFTGTIGTTSAALQIGTSTLTVGVPVTGPSAAIGSGRIRIDLGSATACAATVLNTSNGTTDANLEPVRLIGTNASNTLTVLAGRVGVATTNASETATISELDVSGNATVNYGYGVTWTTANVASGSTFVTQKSGGTTLTVASGGTATVYGSAAVTTVNVTGTLNYNARPAPTTANLYNGGTLDFSANSATGTIGTLNHYKGGTLNTNPAKPNHIAVTTRNLINGGSLVLS